MIIVPGIWEYGVLQWMQPAWEEFNLVEISETTWAATDGVMLYMAERKSELPIGKYTVTPTGDLNFELANQNQSKKFPDWGKYVNGQWEKGNFKTINNIGRSKQKFFHDIVSALPSGLTLNPVLYELALTGMGGGLFHARISMHVDGQIPVLLYPDERDRLVYIMPMREIR